MIRLFVALELPGHVREALLGAMGGVAGARWQKDEQLHLTLRYIGEVDRHRAADIAAALSGVNFRPFSLSLDGVGTFDRRGRIDVLWAGVRPQDEVKLLAKRVNTALAAVGIPAENRAFQPHITVARFGRSAGLIYAFPATPLPITPFMVSGFALWESRLGYDGSNYHIMERYPMMGLNSGAT